MRRRKVKTLAVVAVVVAVAVVAVVSSLAFVVYSLEFCATKMGSVLGSV